jgi:hypothetical protein
MLTRAIDFSLNSKTQNMCAIYKESILLRTFYPYDLMDKRSRFIFAGYMRKLNFNYLNNSHFFVFKLKLNAFWFSLYLI